MITLVANSESNFTNDYARYSELLDENLIDSKPLVEFVKQYGFGVFDDVVFKINGELFGLLYFFGISDDEFFNFEKMNIKFKELVSTFVALAMTVGDSLVCFSKLDKKIYYIDINEEEINPILISNSINDFINHIKEENL